MAKEKTKAVHDSNRAIAMKAARFERKIKMFVKMAKANKIRDWKRKDSGSGWQRTKVNKWTFGPFGEVIGGKFKENIPSWMQPIIEQYSDYYKKEYKPKKTYVSVNKNESNEETNDQISMHQHALTFKKRSGVSPAKKD